MSRFTADSDAWRHEPDSGDVRRLVCQAANPFGLPGKDRSGRLELTEPPDLSALICSGDKVIPTMTYLQAVA